MPFFEWFVYLLAFATAFASCTFHRKVLCPFMPWHVLESERSCS